MNSKHKISINVTINVKKYAIILLIKKLVLIRHFGEKK